MDQTAFLDGRSVDSLGLNISTAGQQILEADRLDAHIALSFAGRYISVSIFPRVSVYLKMVCVMHKNVQP